uniref:Potassium channel tetramerisation-type BTB domain-containing protein n=1 Tax=Oncorhynchus mykiss TaxID=8022 RepID=A0A8C7VQU3_ONCMY
MSAQDLISFNNGGQKFTTTLSTLRRHQDSRIARILDGKDTDFKVISGQVFVDRDWTFFKYILDYMRTGQITLPAEFSDYNGLAQEAQFYGLKHRFFQIFCSNNKSLEALATRISIFVEHPNLNGNFPHLPSHHDMVFQYGTDQLSDWIDQQMATKDNNVEGHNVNILHLTISLHLYSIFYLTSISCVLKYISKSTIL